MFKSNPIYSTYGAPEMKATYQRSMLKSNLIVITTVVLIVAVYQIALAMSPPPPDVGRTILPQDPPVREIPPTPRIICDLPGYTPEAISENTKIGIPVPVDDSLVIDDMMIPTNVERQQILENSMPNPGEGDGGNYEYTNFDTTDHFPAIDEFVVVDKEPEMIKQVQPEYPRLIKKARGEGEVVIRALIDKDGSVLKAVVYKGSGYELLDESALKAAYKNKYSPAVKANDPVRVWVSYKVKFKLH